MIYDSDGGSGYPCVVKDFSNAGARSGGLLMSLSLTQARSRLAAPECDLAPEERRLIVERIDRDASERLQRDRLRYSTRPMAALALLLFLGIGAGLAWASLDYLPAGAVMLAEAVWPTALAADRLLKPGDRFKECADCPEMVVVPAGEFMMGSAEDEKFHQEEESPRHKVRIANALAVARFEATFEEWDACALVGGCANRQALDLGWGRGRRPVIFVTWKDAEQYAAWLAWRTGKPYRLLTEAEYEYATRAGAQTAYPWGDNIGKNNANCIGCGSKWDGKQTAPVGSFKPNAFGLYDMVGNVFEWVEDCVHNNYDGAPTDGSAWIEGGNCENRVDRGGAWFVTPVTLRSAFRYGGAADGLMVGLGFRVGRTLLPP